MNKNTLSRILKHIFSAVIALCLFYIALIFVLKFTVTDQNAADSEFYTILADELTAELKAYAPSTGVEEGFFDRAFDRSEFENDTREFIAASYNGTETADIRARVKDGFYQKLCDYAQNEGYMLTDDITAALSNLADICADKYMSYSSGSVIGLIFKTLGKVSRLYDEYLPILSAVLLAFVVICGQSLKRMCDKAELHKRTTAVLIASSLMCAVAPLCVILCGVTKRIGITSLAVNGFITQLTNGVLYGCLIAAGVLLLFSLLIQIKRLLKKGHTVRK